MRLPNAPLVEVVFEFRWALEGDKNFPVQLHQDPGYPLLAREFAENAKGHGFEICREQNVGPTGPLGHRPHYRFFQNEDTFFPLWQIGPGLLACNAGPEYDWPDFKNMLRAKGVVPYNAVNAVNPGIASLGGAMNVREDGYPLLTVSRGCAHFESEIEGYAWAVSSSGVVSDRPDPASICHLLDCARYAGMEIWSGIGETVQLR